MIHNDHLGTPQKMTDASGVVRWSADYKPFGEATIDTLVTTITNNLRFPGQYYDPETSLHQNNFRDYDFLSGRYPAADPWYSGVVLISAAGPKIRMQVQKPGILSDTNLYSYASDNVLKFIDPTGLWPSGNLLPLTPQLQDDRCSLDFLGSTINNAANNNPCVKKCCQTHDNCYASFNCNWTSWIVNATVGLLGPCNVCNVNAVVCVSAAKIGGCPPQCPK